MRFKMLGGILLIVGTTIGGGMLALPVVTAQGGFWGALALLIASWVVMTFSAFLILEVNMWLPVNSNLIFMVKRTLGPWAAWIAWVCYLVLFYCLLAAYIAGGSDILQGLMVAMGMKTPVNMDAILFTGMLGWVVYKGIQSIDYVNRGFMLIKMVTLFLLIVFIIPHIHPAQYNSGKIIYLIPAVTVVLTSFGFATIIPSLRAYFNNDVATLRKVILIGSVIPLICYILWVGVIFGGIPYAGSYGLLSMVHSEHSTLALTQALIYHLQQDSITALTRVFTSVCVMTSFLGVSLCVVDFLADGLNLEMQGMKKGFVHLITFVPPLLIALWYPAAFIVGLSYAGVSLAILIILFPALMVWFGRYRKHIVADYRVMGGKAPLILLIGVALFVIAQGVIFR